MRSAYGAFKQVNLDVYVDQYPILEQDDTLKTWSVDLRKFLQKRYALNSTFKRLFLKTCSKEEDHDTYDDIDSAFEANPQHVNIAIYRWTASI